MFPSAGDVVPLALALAIPAAAVYLVMPRYIELLRSKGRTTNDAHKGKEVRVPTPAGPLLIGALVVGEVVAWAFYGSVVPLVLIVVVLSCGLIGLYDDLRGLGGVVKPAAPRPGRGLRGRGRALLSERLRAHRLLSAPNQDRHSLHNLRPHSRGVDPGRLERIQHARRVQRRDLGVHSDSIWRTGRSGPSQVRTP